MNKSIIGAIVVVIASAIIFGVVILNNNDEEVATNTQNAEDAAAQVAANKGQVTYTVEEVAVHNTGDDCWTHINGNVYDITEYVPRHPGGDEILRACGADGTSLFEQRQTDEGESVGSGLPHSSNAKSLLDGYSIGILE